MSVAIRYRPSRTVKRFMKSDDFVRAIVGPVGSGKSSGCVVEIVRRAAQQAKSPDGIRRSRWAVIRNTYGQLRDTTRKTFEQWVPNEMGEWHEQPFTFTLRFNDVRAEVLFRALDRPEDVKKLLSLELTGAYINEAREIPKAVFEVLQARVGRYPSKAQGGASWFGVWMDTNPWHVLHWGYKLFSETKPEGHGLFEQPGGRADNAENVENLPPGYYERLCAGKDAEWVSEYVDSKYPASDRGSVYGQLIQELKARGGVCEFEHPTDGVYVNLDLGISDSTSLWFWRLSKGLDFVDHYEAHGEPLSHFFDAIKSRDYGLTKIFLPHDAKARTLQTGVSVYDQFTKEFPGLVAMVPSMSIADRLQATRFALEQPETRIHSRCSQINGPTDIDGIEALASYKYEYDEDRKVYSRRPLHDWTSHTADSAGYAGLVWKYSELVSRPVAEAKPVEPSPALGAPIYSLPPLSSIRSPGRGRL